MATTLVVVIRISLIEGNSERIPITIEIYIKSQRCFDDDEKEKKSFYQFESEFRIRPFEKIDLWLSTSILCSNLTKRKEVNLITS